MLKAKSGFKKIVIGTVALIGASVAQAEMIVAGQWLQLNFTNTELSPPYDRDNFNVFYSANSGANATTGSSTEMIDSLGNSVDASLTASGFGGTGHLNGSNNDWSGMGDSTPAPGTSTWSDEEIVNFWWANGATPTIAIDGLDASLSYNVYIYSKANGGQAGEVTTVDINGTRQDMAKRSDRFLDSDEDLLFQNVELDGDGDLVITMLNGPGSLQYNPILNSIVIEAIPEPATFGLLGITGAAALFIRRRFMM